MRKLIVITGGDADNVDKGILAGGIGILLQANDYPVTALKMDPCYIKDSKGIDCARYGEKYIFNDGNSGAINHGHYERLLGLTLTEKNDLTMGKIFEYINSPLRFDESKNRENNLITGTIDWINDIFEQPINENGDKPVICIIELCIADYDKISGNQFFEALSELKDDDENNNNSFLHIHIGEIMNGLPDSIKKSSQTLRLHGWKSDIIICRTKNPLNDETFKESIETMLKTETEKIIFLPKTCDTKYIPILLQKHYNFIANKLKLKNGPNFETRMKERELEYKKAQSYDEIVKIAIIGKFVHPSTNDLYLECYESIEEHLKTAAAENCCKAEIIYLLGQDLENNDPSAAAKKEATWNKLRQVYGICIPTACGDPGTFGFIDVCTYARNYEIPLLCFGYAFQVALFEFSQNVIGLNPGILFYKIMDSIFVKMPENGVKRIGQREIWFLTKDSILFKLYGSEKSVFKDKFSNIFEIDPSLIPKFHAHGLKFVGITFDEDRKGKILPFTKPMRNIAADIQEDEKDFKKLIEKLMRSYDETGIPLRMAMFELKNHPFFIGLSYHPKCGHENPAASSPPYVGLIKAALDRKEFLKLNVSSQKI